MTCCFLTLAGCASTGSSQSIAEAAGAAAGQAVAEASIDIGLLPAECYVDTEHAALVPGEEVVVILRRERGQVDEANAKRYRCASYHNGLRQELLNRN